VIFTEGRNLGEGGFSISLVKKIKPNNFSLFKTGRVGLVKGDDFSEAHYRFISCRADYLRQVVGEFALCDEILKNETLKEIALEALALPA
tara:strand:- start:2259 stop:2528 length:270 start_codon:yes stop_codon:yes gene_type:complete